jgi:hypothetical protein
MFDFRYHALSLVAVFLALGIGIILGASLGDQVVSGANKDVRSSLRGDLIDARQAVRGAQKAVSNRDDFISASFEHIAADQLRGQRVAIVSSGKLPQNIESAARTSVTDAGGSVDSISQFDVKPDLLTIGGKLGGRYQLLGTAPEQLRELGRKLGASLVDGSKAPKKLEDAFPDSFKGDYSGADAIVYYRADGNRDGQSKTFESAIIQGLRDAGVPIVGVERGDTDPSQIPYYVDAGLSTVDDTDQPAGHIALVLALAGAEGNFGFKGTADAPLPPASGK